MPSQFLNQFSFPLIGGLVLIVLLLFLRRIGQSWQHIARVQLIIGLFFVTSFFILRPGDSDVNSLEAAAVILQNQQPTFIEFFSNYCTGCLVIRPAVDTFIAELDDGYNVLRVNIHSPLGRELRERYGFSFTPEFLVLDAQGSEVYRGHSLPDRVSLQPIRATSQSVPRD